MKRILSVLVAVSFLGMASGQETDYLKFGMQVSGGKAPAGIQVGEKAPSFSGYDQAGKFTESSKILQKGPMVLFFYRGYWCPACNRTLSNYQDSLGIITDQGVSVVAITPESIEYVESTVKANNISFTVIYDCQEKIMMDYDVMFDVSPDYQAMLKEKNFDLTKINMHPEAHLPVPATYIINSQGIVVAAWFDPKTLAKQFRNKAII
ncbi:MAG: AhpC/TSA family protein [Bacteroidales bacterium]|nr:AhpC/TSA family protein [Bacteroidales bacterium]